MSRTFSEDLTANLRNREAAHDFGEAIAKVDIAFTLAEARRGSGVTQKELASRVGTTQSYIAKLERGDANPSIGRIGRLLAALGMRLSPSIIPMIGLARTYPVQPTLSSGTGWLILKTGHKLLLPFLSPLPAGSIHFLAIHSSSHLSMANYRFNIAWGNPIFIHPFC